MAFFVYDPVSSASPSLRPLLADPSISRGPSTTIYYNPWIKEF
ncbi:MAG: hypothetical protein QW118_08390 [Nitrososphaerota archaeon]